MGRKSAKSKATAFIKIVRSPTGTAGSLFRYRGLSGRLVNVIFKLFFTILVAYVIYSSNHPDEAVPGWINAPPDQPVKKDQSLPQIGGGLQPRRS